MGRQKKIKTVQVELKLPEVKMKEEAEAVTVLDMGKEQELESIQSQLDLATIELEKTKMEIAAKKKELETMPRREISVDEQSVISRQKERTEEKKVGEDLIEKQRTFDKQLVTGRFMNQRAPGQPVKLPYIKYADDPVKWFPFEHNKIYTIPRGFADQINEHYYTPNFIQKEGNMDPNRPATAIHEVDTSNKRYAFVPINF